jgi:hypothetical protein
MYQKKNINHFTGNRKTEKKFLGLKITYEAKIHSLLVAYIIVNHIMLVWQFLLYFLIYVIINKVPMYHAHPFNSCNNE